MRQTKRRLEPYSFFNPAGICRHLEKQASEGWMLEKVNNRGWHYRRGEPKKLKYAVSYYAQASEFDPEPTEGQLRFQEFCAHTGWQLVCATGQLQIFCNDQEDPTPIWTEPELELEAIHAAAKKSHIPMFAVYLFLGLMQGFIFYGNLTRNFIYLLSSPAQLLVGMCAVLLLVLSLTELGAYFSWLKQARKAVPQGHLPLPPDTAWVQKAVLVFLGVGVICFAVSILLTGDRLYRLLFLVMGFYIPLLTLLVNGVKNYLKKRKASRSLNQTITFASSFLFAFLIMGGVTWFFLSGRAGGWFAEKEEETYEYRGSTFVLHQDQLPLTVEDLLEVDHDGYIKERRGSESIFLGQLIMRQHPRFDAEDYGDIPQLAYTLTVVKMPWLYDFCKEELTKTERSREVSYRLEDAAPWGAREAYRLYGESGPRDNWLLCYEHTLVEIDFDWEPTEDQKRTVGEKLGS